MRRLGMLLLVAVCPMLAGAGAGAGPAGAAESGPAVCTGTWAMHTVFDFDLLRPMRHSFEMTPAGATGVSAACTGGHVGAAAGMLNGVCFGATGGGVLDGDHTFSVEWRGANLVFTGEVVGTLTIAADPTTGTDRCIGGSADDFTLTGTLALP